MATKNHPKSVPGVPYIFPDWLDYLQRTIESPLIKRFHLPTFAVVEHRGRVTGTPYRTVVRAFCKGPVLAVMLGHGKADWVRNVLAAGEADVRLFRRRVHITDPRLVRIGDDTSGLPWIVRLGSRWVGVLAADIT